MKWWTGLAMCALLAATGCKDIDCSSEPEPGVEVRITESGPGPHTDPITVRFRIDGGAWTDVGDTMSGCAERTFCQLGWELAGAYEIEVSRGGATVTTFVDVSADFCHVRTQPVSVLIPDA